MQLQRAPVALDAVVRSAAQDQQAEAERADLILRLSLAEGLWVMGDFDRLQQIVLNLLTNAIKFTPAGGEVRVSVQRQEERGRIVVEDTGIGIDPALRGHLFEMFRQGDVAGQHRPGLGIGLALTKSLTEMHGGQVWAESEGAGKDSRFTVELPLIPAPVKPGGRDERGPIHALLVEDNPDTHCLLQDGLELAGYTVDAAESAKDALTRLARTTPDLILADIGLPGMDGYEMLRHARQMPGLARVPAFAVTALGQDEDVRRAQEAGYEGHFVKPVDVTVLSERIRGRLAARSTTLTDRLTPARTTPADPPPAR